MLVYGDRDQLVATDAFFDGLNARARRLGGRGSNGASGGEPDVPGTAPAAEAARRVLIDAGRLTQAILDDAWAARGRCDGWTDVERACGALLLAAGRAALGLPADVARENMSVRSHFQRPTLRLRDPEGFAFYAVYPEQYAAAARRFRARFTEPVVVLGLRSIGTSLAGIVAAALGSELPPITLRPVGPVFDRDLRVDPALETLLTSHRHARFAVVDEGPGLSGSSFAAVARWLERHGVPRARIHFFPSHENGPGPEAPPHVRSLWDDVAVHHEPFESAVLDTLLPSEGREDLSGGLWKRLRPDLADAPVDPSRERRKYLVTLEGERVLARFAGLGETGERKAARARALADAGFTPPFRGLRHGFLLERWHDARQGRVTPAHLHRYLAFRQRTFPLPREAGAGVPELWNVVRRNVSEDSHSPGSRLAALDLAALDGFEPALAAIDEARRPVAVDGRLHAWEWLEIEGDRVLKADAIDHADAHDCVGAQDIAWDVAGAVVECECPLTFFDDLAPEPRPPLWHEFHLLAYAAFQLGLWTNAGHARQVERYRTVIARVLGNS